MLWNFFQAAPTLIFFKPPADDKKTSLGLMFQTTAAKYSNKSAIVCGDSELTWGQFNALTNQYAHSLKSQGVARGDCVAVLIENRTELLCSIFALAKIGATAGLVNTGLTDRPLAHCISVVESKKCLVGQELLAAISGVKGNLTLQDKDYLWVADPLIIADAPDWATDFSATLAGMPTDNLPETDEIVAGEIALYIFTSGTTGLPKPALIYHRKIMSAAKPYSKAGFHAKPSDRLYICLPLYHATGFLLGIGSCLHSGASMFVRRRFSATQFWPEVQKHQTTLFIYVGELCRYLAMAPECPDEKNNPLKTMLGNGLRPDIWDTFRNRFGVKRITEIYGSSEGNVSLLNILNKESTIGTGSVVVMLVKYDIENDEIVLDEDGKVIEVEPGEAGLMLGQIDDLYKFDGYKNADATNDKILTDLREPGDRWFNTGDLIRTVDVGFAMGLPHYQFVDRVGDTFRWRAENVSTNEVGEILNACDQVEISNVYGVDIPGAEGKAGMAAITLTPGQQFNAAEFTEFVDRELPAFARPVFVRIEQEQDTTGTFKLFKGKLKQQAYHLDQVDEPIYVRQPKSKQYELLDRGFYEQLINGSAGY
ncbi:MAG: long-chain-acyl-CoA synthetase [Porticoccaceae bacterium]|nr:long-chain-acyl-CoA synthetase [Porticoccaceae bacterium]